MLYFVLTYFVLKCSQDLLDDNEYDGATLGVVRNGQLVFAEGYGKLGDRNLHASTLMPIST